LLPVADGAPDNIIGVVKVRDVQALLLAGKRVQIARVMKKAEIIPDQLDAMDEAQAWIGASLERSAQRVRVDIARVDSMSEGLSR
jgi:Mg2+/Co2+ transporter CorB